MSGPYAESGHAPEPVDPAAYAERIAWHFWRRHDRGETDVRVILRDLLDAGVIVAGPAVTGRIEEVGS